MKRRQIKKWYSLFERGQMQNYCYSRLGHYFPFSTKKGCKSLVDWDKIEKYINKRLY